ncbi:hypothetical protein VFPPC_06158 [Pochonia chlamydosporia 170]|uniref:Uncharacterized protein n=1 Tax=Pochonia chlamydosporia 170 TaxID=1380566 RepID=A0A179FIW4_METCM|nr:hypothetical protein VFPPC_06158 [Pochonia chlamydosporia 170]OAQ64979.1 hypothetical protein VFPPC_06158 [Pochonia chlamydosporia 170]
MVAASSNGFICLCGPVGRLPSSSTSTWCHVSFNLAERGHTVLSQINLGGSVPHVVAKWAHLPSEILSK